MNAGDYYMIVSGDKDGDYRGQKQCFDFTVDPYDVSKANLVAADVEWGLTGGDTTKTRS